MWKISQICTMKFDLNKLSSLQLTTMDGNTSRTNIFPKSGQNQTKLRLPFWGVCFGNCVFGVRPAADRPKIQLFRKFVYARPMCAGPRTTWVWFQPLMCCCCWSKPKFDFHLKKRYSFEAIIREKWHPAETPHGPLSGEISERNFEVIYGLCDMWSSSLKVRSNLLAVMEWRRKGNDLCTFPAVWPFFVWNR